MKNRKVTKCLLGTLIGLIFLPIISYAGTLDQQLTQTATPYIKYYLNRAVTQAETTNPNDDMRGFTRSFQLSGGTNNYQDEQIINTGTSNYEQAFLGRICLANNITTILDRYTYFFRSKDAANNPVFESNNNYVDANNQPIPHGPFKIIRILNRDPASYPDWWGTGKWDFTTDTGAAAYIALLAMEGYQKTNNQEYRDMAVMLGDYFLRMRDTTDGGLRYAPRNVYHINGPEFFWNMKSTEQNENALYALQALFTITNDTKYDDAAQGIKSWLKNMYDKNVHLFHTSSTYYSDGRGWVAQDFGYVATDVTAFAPIDLMFEDTYFGTTQDARDAEVDAMFAAIESRTAFRNSENKPLLFRFSVSQENSTFGTVEMSAQMALAYLRVAQKYSARGQMIKSQEYLDKYNTLIASLETYFTTISSSDADNGAKISPYASYYETGLSAGNVRTGTGYFTYNCSAALASAFHAFAKSGYDPIKLGGGPGIPPNAATLDLSGVTWYENIAPYLSTGLASAQMILNYIREGAGQSAVSQGDIYSYVRGPTAPTNGPDLTPDEMNKALGHFDPYDTIISNWSDSYNSLAAGNPYKGYNFGVETFDPRSDTQAMNKYMRDICYWIDYPVTQQEWWNATNRTLAAKPYTPAAVPILGSYNHWVVIKGYAASAIPNPTPYTNPGTAPDFTVYGFMIKDPLINGLGQDTYKTAEECLSTYFLPLNTTDAYNGKLLHVAEPPAIPNYYAKASIQKSKADTANLEFIGVRAKTQNYSKMATTAAAPKKRGWKDIIDSRVLLNPEAQAAFKNTTASAPIFVRRTDNEKLNYYLLPFGKQNNKTGSFLTSGAAIIDGNDGHFREASWSKTPQAALSVDKNSALSLLKSYVLKDFYKNVAALPKAPQMPRYYYYSYYSYYSYYNSYYARNIWNRYWTAYWNWSREYNKRWSALYNNYTRLMSYINRSNTELNWQPKGPSASPYKPYWKINANGYIWIVTQEKKVIPQTQLNTIINQIGYNKKYLESFLKNN